MREKQEIAKIISDLSAHGIHADYDWTGGGTDYAHVDLSDKYFLWINEDIVYKVYKEDTERVIDLGKYTDTKKLVRMIQIQIAFENADLTKYLAKYLAKGGN